MRNTSDTLEIMVIFNNESLKHNETIPHLKSFCSVDDKTKSLSYLNNAARYQEIQVVQHFGCEDKAEDKSAQHA